MVEVLNKKEIMKPTPRVERLREVFLNQKGTIELDRSRIETRVMKETEGEPMVTRRAKAFAAVVREMPVSIAPDELFVGYIGAKPGGVSAEVRLGPSLEYVLGIGGSGGVEELLRYSGIVIGDGPKKALGEKSGIYISDEVKRELENELLPYWRAQAQGKGSPFHWGHHILDWERLLKKGFLGIKKEAEERLAKVDYTNPDELRKVPFLESVIMAMEAAAEIGLRFATKARELAEKEDGASRKAELLKLAEVCDWVPANPARTFYEALQSVWFAYILAYWETMAMRGLTPARMDQYLYPYYESDIREERLTKEEAQELIDCFFMKLQDPSWDPEDDHFFIVGDLTVPHLSVGGYKADGSDATNELSYMFIEAMMHTRVPQPDLGVLIHSKTPDDLLIKACQLVALGIGQPAFHNSDVIIPALLARGTASGKQITLEDARNATEIGCLEPVLNGIDGGNQAGHINMPLCLELALNNGVNRVYHKKMGLETGDPKQFKSFEEVQEAYKKQMASAIRDRVILSNTRELSIAEMQPTLFQSALTDGCIENGLPREAGGACYPGCTGFFATGLPDVADSLTAIKKVVFEDKKVTMAQLCDALDKNFEGYEELRQMLLKAPKYGNEDDYADEQMVWASHEYAVEGRNYKNARGGKWVPGSLAFSTHAAFGKVVGALPSGRLAGTPVANGSGPCEGSSKKGPTAVLNSLSKVNAAELSNGVGLNMRFDPAVFKNGDGFKRLADFIRTLVEEKLFHIQINVISSDILRAAQKQPEKHKDLVVRVAGYCARFIYLPKSMQDDIIVRTEHRL